MKSGLIRLFVIAALVALSITVSHADSYTVPGGNPCEAPDGLIQSISGVTTGTALTKIISLVASQQIYICGVYIQGVSGTSPTMSLSYGTGVNCASGTTVLLTPIATAAGSLFNFGRLGHIPPGNELCYTGGGTTPVQNYLISYIQK